MCPSSVLLALLWCHNECNGISNHQPHDCLPNGLFRCRSKKTSKLHITGLCVGNSSVTGEIPAQRASDAENVSIWWRHHKQAVWFMSNVKSHHTANPYGCTKAVLNTIHALHLCHNEDDGISNQQCLDCLLNCLFTRRSKKTLMACSY